MDEHTHEWATDFYGDWVCKVDGCGIRLKFAQVRRRLNEHEQLVARNTDRFAAITKAHEMLGSIEEAPFKDQKEVDGAIQEAYDILDEAIRKHKGE